MDPTKKTNIGELTWETKTVHEKDEIIPLCPARKSETKLFLVVIVIFPPSGYDDLRPCGEWISSA